MQQTDQQTLRTQIISALKLKKEIEETEETEETKSRKIEKLNEFNSIISSIKNNLSAICLSLLYFLAQIEASYNLIKAHSEHFYNFMINVKKYEICEIGRAHV